MTDAARRLEKLLYRQVKQTCVDHELLAPGDRVMVAMSGGKDSYTLMSILGQLVPRLPFRIELVAVHLDQRQPGYDGAGLRAWLERSGFPFEILSEDTYSVVTAHLDDASTYCSLCSRLRRGILYTVAERLGCTKIALGHHRDDSLETFLLNLFYSGKLQAMPARYRTDDGRFEVIRPLIECAETTIAEYAGLVGYPIIPCNLCGSQDGLKRDAMSRLLAELERDHPHLRNVMFNALRNVRPSHLLDRDVARAWAERDPEIRPAAPAPERREHAAAEPVAAAGTEGMRGRRLPVISLRRAAALVVLLAACSKPDDRLQIALEPPPVGSTITEEETTTQVTNLIAGERRTVITDRERKRAEEEILELSGDAPSRIAVRYDAIERSQAVDGDPPEPSPSAIAGRRYLVWRDGDQVRASAADGAALSGGELDEVLEENRELGEVPRLSRMVTSRAWKRGERVVLDAEELAALSRRRDDARIEARSAALTWTALDDGVATFEAEMVLVQSDDAKTIESDMKTTVRFDVARALPVEIVASGTTSGTLSAGQLAGVTIEGMLEGRSTFTFESL